MLPQEARTPPLHSRQHPRSKGPCPFGSCGAPTKVTRGLTRGALCHTCTSSIMCNIPLPSCAPYLFLCARNNSSFVRAPQPFLRARHTSSFMSAIPLSSCAPHLLLHALPYLFLRARHMSSECTNPGRVDCFSNVSGPNSLTSGSSGSSNVGKLRKVRCCGIDDQCSFLRLTWGRKPLMPYVPAVHAVP